MCQLRARHRGARAECGADRRATAGRSQTRRVLLSVGELNGIMGATEMEVISELDEMTDHSAEVSDPDCLGAVYGAEEPVYAGTGWTAMRDQLVREPDEDNEHWVEQTAVLYHRPRTATFFDDSKSPWENCSGHSVRSTSSRGITCGKSTAQRRRHADHPEDSARRRGRLGLPARAVGRVEPDRRGLGLRLQHHRRGREIANDMVANAAKE